jgi:tetratricopeptide (TPR) repeat protein
LNTCGKPRRRPHRSRIVTDWAGSSSTGFTACSWPAPARAVLEIGQRALALAAEVGDPGLQESASFYLAQVHHWAGNYRQGADLLRRTVSSLEDELARLGMPAKQYVNCRMILAWCLAELGVFGEALTYAQEAIAAAEKRATAYDLVHAYSGAGLVHLRRGDFRAAATTAGRAVKLCQGRDFSALWAMSASIVGPAYVALGQITEAIALLEHAAEIVAALAAPVLGFLAEAYMVAGRLQEARATADRAIQLATDGGEQGWLAWSLRLLGELAARSGSRDEAAQHYVRALQLAEGLGMRPLAAHCHRGLGGSHLDAAIPMYREMDMRAFLAPS